MAKKVKVIATRWFYDKENGNKQVPQGATLELEQDRANELYTRGKVKPADDSVKLETIELPEKNEKAGPQPKAGGGPRDMGTGNIKTK